MNKSMRGNRSWTRAKLAEATGRLEIYAARWNLNNAHYDPETACRPGYRMRCRKKDCVRCNAIRDQVIKFTRSSDAG